MGFQPCLPLKKKHGRRIWIHALSVGEVNSSLPFIAAFKKAYPQWEIIFTASTRTGYEIAAQQFSDKSEKPISHLLYFPFDIGFSIRKIAGLIVPDAVVLVETDLWPNFLYIMKTRKIPVILINARLSTRSLRGYQWYKRLGLPFYMWLTQVMTQSPLDYDRFKKLGMPEQTLCITGNIKFDRPAARPEDQFCAVYKKRLGIEKDALVLLAGSTHAGEEAVLLKVYTALKKKYPFLKMVIAPRDPSRSRALAASFLSSRVRAACLSHSSGGLHEDTVMFIDSLGLLSKLYALCDIAFIGGSLVPSGGHNPLEAAVYAKPVVFGPNVDDFLMIYNVLTRGGGAVRVRSEDHLQTTLDALLCDPGAREKMGRKSRAVFLQHHGAVGRILEKMESLNLV